MKRWSVLVAAVGLAAVVAGCASSSAPQTVEVKTNGMAFATKEVTVKKGQTVKLTFNNPDVQLHDFSIDKIPAKAAESHGDSHDHGAAGAGPQLHVAADAGKTGTLEFTPTEAGTYTFYCTVAGHKEAGMTGTLVVK